MGKSNQFPDIYERVKEGMTTNEVESSLGKKPSSSTPVGIHEMRIWNCLLGDYLVLFDSQTKKATSAVFCRTMPETFLEKVQRWLGRKAVTDWYLF